MAILLLKSATEAWIRIDAGSVHSNYINKQTFVLNRKREDDKPNLNFSTYFGSEYSNKLPDMEDPDTFLKGKWNFLMKLIYRTLKEKYMLPENLASNDI